MKKKVVSLFLLLELVGVALAHNCLENDVGSFNRVDLVGGQAQPCPHLYEQI
jgi:hypothetical protein